jgi:hypothetical protein
LLDEINRERGSHERRILTEAVARAEGLTASGQIDDARYIWQSIIDLYDADPHATDAVTQARRWLDEHPPAALPDAGQLP